MKSNILDDLRAKYGVENVLLKHDIDNLRSVGIIIAGNNLHVGVSLRHMSDQRNKRKARFIALGRAHRAEQVFNGAPLRIREQLRKTPLTFTLPTDSSENMKQAITDLFTGEFFKNW
jgi:hypothetical protein